MGAAQKIYDDDDILIFIRCELKATTAQHKKRYLFGPLRDTQIFTQSATHIQNNKLQWKLAGWNGSEKKFIQVKN